MAFSEATKREARQRAHYQCVIYRTIAFVEVHHIVPQAEDGADSIDNAAPLCATCHAHFGGNPEKRSMIREMRDFVWKQCERIEAGEALTATFQRLDHLQELGKESAQKLGRAEETLAEMKALLLELVGEKCKAIQSADNFDDIARSSQSFAPGTFKVWKRSRQRGTVLLRAGELAVSVSISRVTPARAELSWDPRPAIRAHINTEGTAVLFSRRSAYAGQDEFVDFEVVEDVE
jgi:hypothetical protein